MISQEQNEALTRTNQGSLMGDFFRRYWIPALHVWELPEPDCAPVRVKLLGEELIAFRDSENRIGLIDEFCAHRGVSLWFGRNEESGLRCPYHGWKFDVSGQCVDLPSEGDDGPMRKRMKLNAYPCIEAGGVIWTYMGPPELMPEPPALEWVKVAPERRYSSKRLQECNYLQAMEGGIDSSHVTFLHSGALKTDPLFKGTKGNQYNEADKKPHFDVVEFEGGLLIGARRNADQGKYYWRITPWILPWYSIIPPRGKYPLGAHAWVPIDDHNCWTWSINYHPARALSADDRTAMAEGRGIHSKNIPGTFNTVQNKSNNYLMDRSAQKAGIHYSGVEGIGMQDASLQESMGLIQNRTKENLCPTDRGIVMMRRMLMEGAQANRDGKEIIGLDPAVQRVRSCAIELEPHEHYKDAARHGLFAELGTDPVSV